MAKKKTDPESGENGKSKTVQISPPNLQTAEFLIIGTSPYVQNKFSAKAKQQMIDKQKLGDKAKKGAKREPKDFKQCYEQAQYKPQGLNWLNGAIPATAFKASMISACRLCGFKMTMAKQCVFIEADGFDKDDGVPLIKISKGKPAYFEQALPNQTGVMDIRVRPKWQEGWEAKVRVTFDADLFALEDVSNLLMRAGKQCGIGEGRAASKKCAGCGWGEFKIAENR